MASLNGLVIPERRWKLLSAEDTEEFLRSDGRARVGTALSRAPIVTDGVLAQGTQVLVLFTTNEERGRLHPAITRPGRCLSVIEFNAFTPTDSGQGLRTNQTPLSPMSLAELYKARNSPDGFAVQRTPETAGQYLQARAEIPAGWHPLGKSPNLHQQSTTRKVPSARVSGPARVQVD